MTTFLRYREDGEGFECPMPITCQFPCCDCGPTCPRCNAPSGQYGREVIAQWMMERGYATGHSDTVSDLLTELEGQAKQAGRRDASAASTPVWCVMCIDDDDNGCCVHIFSTQEKAHAFADSDPRPHAFYDYMIDHPERMEQAAPWHS